MKEPKWLDDYFLRSNKLGQYWYNHASDLRAGALVLWNSYANKKISKVINGPSIGLYPAFSLEAALPDVFKMLAALSLEILLKACIIRRDGNNLRIRKTHDLNLLAGDAGYKTTSHQRKVFGILSHYSVWAGKYPTPAKKMDFEKANELAERAMRKLKPGLLYPLRINKRLYVSIWKRIETHYKSIEPFYEY